MVLKHIAICCVLVGFGFLTNKELTLIFLTLAPLPAILARYMYYGKVLAAKYAKEKEMYGKAIAISTEVLTHMRSIVSFAREEKEIDRFKATLSSATEFAVKTFYNHAIGIAVFFLLLYGSYAYAFQEGCKRLLDKSVTPNELYSVFFGVTMAVFSVAHILPWISTISSAYGSKLVLTGILNSNPEIDVTSCKGKTIRHLRGKLKFENVSFAYPTQKSINIVNNFNLEMQGNQTIGILGADGAGKTTLVNLLLRFYDVTSGAIKIDDVDLKDLNVRWLRNHISIVPELALFRQETILQNLIAGHTMTSFEEIVEAAKLADADEFIRSLPQGYETVIGVTETELARHEKQRISITRALVRKPFWLIFDDCLEDLPDYEKVMEKIRKSRRGGATIILSGRTNVVKCADVIHVFKDGKIIESGTHEELLEKNGVYLKVSKKEHQIAQQQFLHTHSDSDPARGIFMSGFEDKPSPQYLYKGFWKMLKLVNRNDEDWNRWKMAGLGCLLTGISLPVFAFFSVDIFDTFGESEKNLQDKAEYWTIFLGGIAVVTAVGCLYRIYYISVAGEYAILRLRLFTYISILRRPISWFDNVENSPSTLCSRLASEVPYIKTALDNRIGIGLSGLVSVIVTVFIALAFCWELGLIIIGSMVVLALLIYTQVKIQRGGQLKEVELMDFANALFTQAIQRIWTIQAFTQEQEICERYREKINQDLKQRHKECVTFALIYAISSSLMYFLFATTFRYGVHLINENTLEPETLYRIFLVLTFCLIVVSPTIGFISDLTKAELSFARTLSLIDGEENFKVDPIDACTISPWIEGSISFENVVFRYPSRKSQVLNGCSFTVPVGSTLGLTGGFGSGKTTVLSLIQRFYEPDSGKILIDGEDLLGINVGHLRTNIGYVPTEPSLFNCTIEENISYGYCGEVEGPGLRVLVEEAVETADLKMLIERYPDFRRSTKKIQALIVVDFGVNLTHLKPIFQKCAAESLRAFNKLCQEGYNTIIQREGVGLSTIEKKKVAFARALIRSPRILLIDEPMVGLSASDEIKMLEFLNKIKVGLTCIVTTARVELLKRMDNVAILQGGKITEYGTQEEFSALQNGFYSSLIQQYESSETSNCAEIMT